MCTGVLGHSVSKEKKEPCETSDKTQRIRCGVRGRGWQDWGPFVQRWERRPGVRHRRTQSTHSTHMVLYIWISVWASTNLTKAG